MSIVEDSNDGVYGISFDEELHEQSAALVAEEQLMDVVMDMQEAGGVSMNHVIALEAAVPGIIMDSYPMGGFTKEASKQNAVVVYGAVNSWISKNHGGNRVALESWTAIAGVALGVGVFAALVAIIRWVVGLISGTGSKGGGGTPTQVIKQADKAAHTGKAKVEEKVQEVKKDAKEQAESLVQELKDAKTSEGMMIVHLNNAKRSLKTLQSTREKLLNHFERIDITDKELIDSLYDVRKLQSFMRPGLDMSLGTYDTNYAIYWTCHRVNWIIYDCMTNASKLNFQDHLLKALSIMASLRDAQQLSEQLVMDVAKANEITHGDAGNFLAKASAIQSALMAGGMFTAEDFKPEKIGNAVVDKWFEEFRGQFKVEISPEEAAKNLGRLDPELISRQMLQLSDAIERYVSPGVLTKLADTVEKEAQSVAAGIKAIEGIPVEADQPEVREHIEQARQKLLTHMRMAAMFERQILQVVGKLTASIRRFAAGRSTYYEQVHHAELTKLLEVMNHQSGHPRLKAILDKAGKSLSYEEAEKQIVTEFDKIMSDRDKPINF